MIDPSFLAGTVGATCVLVLKLGRSYLTKPDGYVSKLLKRKLFAPIAIAMILASGGVAWGLLGELTTARAPNFLAGACAYYALRDAIKTFLQHSIQRRLADNLGDSRDEYLDAAIP